MSTRKRSGGIGHSRPIRAIHAGFLVVLLVGTASAQHEPSEVVVQGERSERSANSESLGAERARRGAGTQDDPVKALDNVAGVARPGPSAPGLVVWGASASETRIYWDDVPVPWLHHGSGVRSVVPAGILRTLTLHPAAYGPEYGGALGGVVSLVTRETPHELRYRLHADLLDSGALVSTPVGGGATALAAARYGYADRLFSLADGHDAERLYSVPSYGDYYAKVALALNARQSLTLAVAGSGDRLERALPSSDRSTDVRETRIRAFQRVSLSYLDRHAGVRDRILLYVGRDVDERATASVDGGYALELGSVVYGLRAERRESVTSRITLRAGVDVNGALTDVERHGSLSLPPREGDPYVFGAPPGPDRATERYSAHLVEAAPFAEAEFELFGVRALPGVRLATHLLESDHLRPQVGDVPPLGRSDATAALEPRLRVEHTPQPNFVWFAAVGRYHQAPDVRDLGPVFGNPELGPSTATHLLAGERYRLGSGPTFGTTAFVKWVDDLTVRNPAATPATSRLLVSSGEGRMFGAHFKLDQPPTRGFSGSLSLTLSRSERRHRGSGRYRPFDHDQPMLLSGAVQQALGDWSFAALVRFASGAPRTPVVDAHYNTSLGRYEPVFGSPNSQRLPDYFSLDLRVDRRVARIAEADLFAYLDALNVTFAEHAEEVAYSADYTKHEYLTGLPPIVVAGIRLER